MELQEVGKYKVEPFALERILDLRLKKQVNEHARLHLRGILKEGEEDSLIEEAWDTKPVKLTDGGETLFCGAAVDVGVVCENGVYYLEAEAVSWTIKLDQEEKKRSFQEHGMSYNSIAEQLAGEAGGEAVCNAPEKQIRNLLLEYRETDWEFLKRLASHSNSVLAADPAAECPKFSFGVAEGAEYKEEADGEGDFSIRKKVSRYRKLVQDEALSYQEEDAVEYTLKTDHAALELGDMVKRKGKTLYVKEVDIHLTDSVFTCCYGLVTKKGLSVKSACHPHISGLTLTGTVLQAEKDTVRVHLVIDKQQDVGKSYAFPYASGYSAEGHTGWYVMPEEGDVVQVVFPTEDENRAYAVQSVRQVNAEEEDGEKGLLEKLVDIVFNQDTLKVEDPRVKYLRTPDGKEIKLDKDEILITANDHITHIRINADSGVEVRTDKEVLVTSLGSVTVMSGDKISMLSADDFSIHAGKNLKVTAEDSITMNCQKNTLKMETPESGIEMEASKPIKVAGGNTFDIKTKGRFTAETENEMQVTAKEKLQTESKNTLEIKCKGNAIKLESSKRGVAVSSQKEVSVNTSGGMDIYSGKAMQVSSGKNLTVSSKKKLALSASNALTESCKGSSVQLDGNISMKAKLIKEN